MPIAPRNCSSSGSHSMASIWGDCLGCSGWVGKRGMDWGISGRGEEEEWGWKALEEGGSFLLVISVPKF